MSRVTVVVATRNRRATLLRTLPRHRAPVIVVDNGSDDGTVEAVSEAFPHLPAIRLPTNAGAAARNVGVRLARTPYVAFADDDSYWEDDSLDRAAGLLDGYPAAAVLAAQVFIGAERRPDVVSDRMGTSPLGVPPDLPGPAVLGFLACAAVVRRTAFLSVGGFEARLGVYGEEALLAMDLAAAGWGVAYVPELRVRHLPDPRRGDPYARSRVEARNRLLTAWLRRPAGVGLRAALGATGSKAERRGLWDAVRALPWALRHRRVLPAEVESAVALVDRHG